jgi:hypothetical protein
VRERVLCNNGRGIDASRCSRPRRRSPRIINGGPPASSPTPPPHPHRAHPARKDILLNLEHLSHLVKAALLSSLVCRCV